MAHRDPKQMTDQELRRQGAPEGSPVLEEAKNVEGVEVQASNAYTGYKEWPKWMYHRNGDSKVFDSASEFEARAPGEKLDWNVSPHAFGATELRSPATGGAADPAIRAAANPFVPDPKAEPPRLPIVEHLDEAVLIRGNSARDPQREQAVSDSNAVADSAAEARKRSAQGLVDPATGQLKSDLPKVNSKR